MHPKTSRSPQAYGNPIVWDIGTRINPRPVWGLVVGDEIRGGRTPNSALAFGSTPKRLARTSEYALPCRTGHGCLPE
jgi:hypothetical protein